jgi:large subunit ribosomal protein L10
VARPEKVLEVERISDRLTRGRGIVFADYRGLDVKTITELRRSLRAAGVEFKVVKNTLTRLAAGQARIEAVDDLLEGPTALALGYDDAAASARVLTEFGRSHPELTIKGGVLEGQVIDAAKVAVLSAVPSRDELIAQVLRGMQSPISGLAGALQGIIHKLVYVLEGVRKQKDDV